MNSVAIQTVAVKDSSPPAKPAPVADSNALTFFLRGARRPSTIAFGKWVWAKLSAYPEGAPLNLSEAARELGLSRPTLYRSLRFFTRFGRLLPVEGYAVGTHQPGRPRAYRLHPSFFADGKRDSAKRVNLLSTSPKKKKEAKSNPPDIRFPKHDPPQLGYPVTERGRRWALGTVRRELRQWGISGKDRGKIVAGIANSLTRAIKTHRIKTGRELGQAVRLILAILDRDPELRASKLARREGRALYGATSAIVARAVAQVERGRRAEEGTKQILARIRREDWPEPRPVRKEWDNWGDWGPLPSPKRHASPPPPVKGGSSSSGAEARAQVRLKWERLQEAGFSFVELARKYAQRNCGSKEIPPPHLEVKGQAPSSSPPEEEISALGKLGLEGLLRRWQFAGEASGVASPSREARAGLEVRAGVASGPATPGAFTWQGSDSGSGYWVLGCNKASLVKRGATPERIRRLEAEARCGDPEREALARAILRRLRSKVAI